MTRAELDSHQLQYLRHLLKTLVASNPFYSARLNAAGVDESIESIEEFACRVPFTVKQDLVDDQAARPPYGTNLTFPLERYTRFCQTSGTTAAPLRWLDTQESWAWMLENWKRVYQSAGITPADRVFFPFSFGPFLGFWAAFESAIALGCLAIPGGGLSSAARVRTILDNQATVLCCTPTYAIRLAEVAEEEGIDLGTSRIRRIVLAGEPGGCIASTRELIAKLWPGARTVDHHGMTETGPVSYECPRRPGVLHVIESSYIAEVIDPDSFSPVAPGEEGELILTNLGRIGSPLLRYRTRDFVRLSQQVRCECGSAEIALEGGILGRTDDMVVVRGVNLYPSAVEDLLRSRSVSEFNADIRTDTVLPELTIQVEAPSSQTDELLFARVLESAIQNAFALRVTVICVPQGSLPRFEVKAKRWKLS